MSELKSSTISCPLCNRVLCEAKAATKLNIELKCDECGAWFNVVVPGPEKSKEPKPHAVVNQNGIDSAPAHHRRPRKFA